MHPHVRDLYKRILLVGKDYPLGLPYVKTKAKQQFYANAHLVKDRKEFQQAIVSGRWQVKEMIGVIQLKKYRTMNQRYK